MAWRLVLALLLQGIGLQGQDLRELIGGLQSERWQDRFYYYNQLKRPENASPETNNGLVRLLTTENQLIFRA